MFASVSPSEAPAGCVARLRQRAEGRIGLSVARHGPVTRPVRIAQAGSLRIRWPRSLRPALEAVMINTGGGIACGDRLSVEAGVEPGAELVLTTPAAERVYRSDGPVAEISVRLSVRPEGSLAWLPQETILFDQARIRRSLEADLAPEARLLLCEALVFGRVARGEVVTDGLLEDRWRIRRGGRLVYADTLRLSGPIAALLERPAIAGGARALATLVYVAADAEHRLDEARALLAGAECAAGASAWNGLLGVRLLAADAASLRQAVGRFIEGFRGCPLPRVWQS